MEMNSDIFTPTCLSRTCGFEDAPIPAPVEEEKPAETPPPPQTQSRCSGADY